MNAIFLNTKGNLFRPGKSYTPSKPDNQGPVVSSRRPPPKGCVLTNYDETKKSGWFDPLVRLRLNSSKTSYESDEYVSDSTITMRIPQFISSSLARNDNQAYHCEQLIRNSDYTC